MAFNKDLVAFEKLTMETMEDPSNFEELLRVMIYNFGANGSAISPILEKVITLLELHKKEIENAAGHTCLVYGLYHFLIHDFEKSQSDFSYAKENYLNGDDQELAHFCDTLKGIVYRSIGELDKSIQHFEKGLFELEHPKYPWALSVSLFQMGEAFFQLRDYENSEEYFNKGIKASSRLKQYTSLARAYWGIAKLAKRKQNYEGWLSYLEKALEVIEKYELGVVLTSRALSEKAMYFLEKKEYNKALELENRSLEITKEFDLENQLITSFMNLGQIHYYKGEYEESFCQLKKGKELAEKIQVKFKLVKINRYLADVYEKLGLFKEAFLSFKAYNQMNIDLFKEKENKFYKKKNAEIKKQKDLMETIHGQLQSSIEHAKYIQSAMMPSIDEIKKYLPESFILFKPKDIVSGDFYWFHALDEDKIVLATVDCTGHGVPGAMMSMKADAVLTKIIKHDKLEISDGILCALHRGMVEGLHQEENDNNEGMDLSLCIIDLKKKEIDFAGANSSIVIIDNKGEKTRISGNRNGIGGHQNLNATFTSVKVQLNEGDKVYMFSDGYPDQFGGPQKKKIMRGNFLNFISSISKQPFNEQKKQLESFLIDWMNYIPSDPENQIDDILVVGFSI